MAISEENRAFLDGLIDHYASEAGSYRQMAEDLAPGAGSVPDAAFGIIVGCVYSGFLQAYQNQQLSPGLDDVREFGDIIRGRAAEIRGAISGGAAAGAGDGTAGAGGAADGEATV